MEPTNAWSGYLLLALTVFPAAVLAGGFERDTHDLDLLATPGDHAEADLRVVAPHRSLKGVTPLPGHPEAGASLLKSVSIGRTFLVPRFTAKLDVGRTTACSLTYRQMYGVSLDYGTEWVGRTDKVTFDIDSDSLGLTCSYRLAPDEAAGFRLIGGFVEERLEVIQRTVVGASLTSPAIPVTGKLRVSDRATGWRAGFAWELPQYHIWASLLYAAAVPHGYSGSLSLPERLTATGASPAMLIPVRAQADSPRSLQLDLRGGIAPGWLASLMIRKVDWSTLRIVPVVSSGGASAVPAGVEVAALEANFRDGLTVDAGLIHVPTTKLILRAGVAWDRGTATGLNPYTDSWRLTLGVRHQISESVALSAGFAIVHAESGRIEPPAGLRTNYTAEIPADTTRILQVGLRVSF